MTLNFKISPIDTTHAAALQHKIDQKTKPLGALGQLEPLALKLGLIQNTLSPRLHNPTLLIFAGDHGIVDEGVSAYPQSVTAQMIDNFLKGGAAINVFAKQNGLELFIVDAGVKEDLAEHPRLIPSKVAKGTQNFLHAPAMTPEECIHAIKTGSRMVLQQYMKGCNCLGFGEMGIGNSSAAALLLHCLSDIPLAECVGRGTGLNDEQLAHKLEVLQRALLQHAPSQDPLTVLSYFGGYEIAMMVGAFLRAAELGILMMVDGFIASSALWVASRLYPEVLDYCIFSHVSNEQGHRALLSKLNATPLLDLQLRLGEGSGIALAFPLLKAAESFLNEMASFAEAGVAGHSL